MQLDDIVQQVQEQLAAAAALGDDRAREVAGALAAAVAPAIRLAIMAALAAAADEATAALLDAPGAPAVAMRLDGNDVRVDVTLPEAAAEAAPRADEGEATARISLRLSDALKTDVEAAAAREGISVNTWLVRAASSALSPAWPGMPGARGRAEHRGHGNAHRITGWIDG